MGQRWGSSPISGALWWESQLERLVRRLDLFSVFGGRLAKRITGGDAPFQLTPIESQQIIEHQTAFQSWFRSSDDSSPERQPVSAENLLQLTLQIPEVSRKEKAGFSMTRKIVTAIFYVNMDIIMISQFVYCKLKKQEMKKCSKSLKNFCITWIVVCIALCIILLCQLLLRNQDRSEVIKRSNNSLGMIEMSGFICGYISCVFYLGSRFPQLYKNFRRRSTEGTSYLLFALAMMGNCTYGLSLVLRMPATKSLQALYFLHHLPWLIGSFGVLFLDVFVTLQFILYRQQKERQSGLVTLEVEPLLVNEEMA
ncbi:lysosomal amino acid transporter 1 [Amazona aestiva]|uniref:Lysosomal amino acid transporter 1 homolog n=1 Tax=Amazona aestiva TaxID=12930 RepID=A0A0Q3R517_AMAAE|nr:lysosomal amino acid transporter 1 [Amazona aestiva]